MPDCVLWDPRRGGSRAHWAEPCTCHPLRAREQVRSPLGSPRPRLPPAPHLPGIQGCRLDAAAHLARALGNFLLRELLKPSFAVLAPGSSPVAPAARQATPRCPSSVSLASVAGVLVSVFPGGVCSTSPAGKLLLRRFGTSGAAARGGGPLTPGALYRVRVRLGCGPGPFGGRSEMPSMAPNVWYLEIEILERGGGAGLGSFRDGLAPWRPGAGCSPASPGPSSSDCRVSSCPTQAQSTSSDPLRSPRDPLSPRRHTCPSPSASRLGSLSPLPEAVF